MSKSIKNATIYHVQSFLLPKFKAFQGMKRWNEKQKKKWAQCVSKTNDQSIFTFPLGNGAHSVYHKSLAVTLSTLPSGMLIINTILHWKSASRSLSALCQHLPQQPSRRFFLIAIATSPYLNGQREGCRLMAACFPHSPVIFHFNGHIKKCSPVRSLVIEKRKMIE